MMLKLILASAGLVVAAPPPAPPMPQVAERYTLERAGDGFVRLDKVTGEMSFCRIETIAGLVCRLGADERAAYDNKISTLTSQVAALGGKPGPTLEDKKAAAYGEISLVAFILKSMLHAAREVADTAEQEKLAQHPHQSP